MTVTCMLHIVEAALSYTIWSLMFATCNYFSLTPHRTLLGWTVRQVRCVEVLISSLVEFPVLTGSSSFRSVSFCSPDTTSSLSSVVGFSVENAAALSNSAASAAPLSCSASTRLPMNKNMIAQLLSEISYLYSDLNFLQSLKCYYVAL